MSNVTDNLSTLYSYVSGVTELATTTGTSVGGKLADPTVVTGPVPSAWILYAGRMPVDPPKNGVVPVGGPVKILFVVMVYLDNSLGQDNLIAMQLPILDKVTKAVTGKETAGSPGGYRFSFEGERLASISPKRLTYEVRFSIVSYL
jgi:hypothetical protein